MRVNQRFSHFCLFSLCSPFPFCLHFSVWRFILSCCLFWLCFHIWRSRFRWQRPGSPLGVLRCCPLCGADLLKHAGGGVGACCGCWEKSRSWTACPLLLLLLPEELGPLMSPLISFVLFSFFFAILIEWLTTILVFQITDLYFLFFCILWSPAGFW